MKNFFLISIFTFISFSVVAQNKVANAAYQSMLESLLTHSVNEIMVKDVNSDDNVVFLDTRAKKEFKVSHIKYAQWVGFLSYHKGKVKDIPKDKKIILYCSVGYRSEKITEKLMKEGFTNVFNLYGGFFEWVNEEKGIVNEIGPTLEVHPYDDDWGQWLYKGIKTY